MPNKPFIANNEILNILTAVNNADYSGSDTATVGTLTQSWVAVPISRFAGFVLELMVIVGQDTDADDAETVTFIEAFSDAIMPSVVLCDASGGGLVNECSVGAVSETGFTYDFFGGATDKTLNWIACGMRVVAE